MKKPFVHYAIKSQIEGFAQIGAWGYVFWSPSVANATLFATKEEAQKMCKRCRQLMQRTDLEFVAVPDEPYYND
jgi:hypothetical protein